MANFELQGDDGKIYDVEAPDLNSAVAAFKKMQPRVGPTVERAAAIAPEMQAVLDMLNRAGPSATDIVNQGLEQPSPSGDFIRENPQSVANTIARMGQQYANTATLDAADEVVAAGKALLRVKPNEAPSDILKSTLADLEFKRNKFTAEHPQLSDAASAGGILASPLNLYGGEYVAGAKTTPRMMLRGSLTGGATGATQGFMGTQGGLEDRAKGAVLGGEIGAGIGGALPILSAVLAPKMSPEIAFLRSKGVTPTLGQNLGGAAKRFEDKMRSYPLLGGLVHDAQTRSIEDLNRAAINEGLKFIGQKGTGAIGREGIVEMKDAIQASYKDLTSKISFVADQQFTNDMANAKIVATLLPDTEERQLNKAIADFEKKITAHNGVLPGSEYKDIESQLTKLSTDYHGDSSAYVRQLGEQIDDVISDLKSALERSNPMYAEQLKKTNAAWAHYKVVQKAASSIGAEKGVFTPEQLQNAVRAADKTKDKWAFSQGSARVQSISEAGKTALGNKVPDSGTPSRMLPWLIASAAAGQVNPALAIPGLMAGAAALPYTKPGQKIVDMLLNARPGGARSIGQLLPQFTVPFGIGAGNTGAAIAAPSRGR